VRTPTQSRRSSGFGRADQQGDVIMAKKAAAKKSAAKPAAKKAAKTKKK
jgi:hypothetical protein